jgi:site-specific DNA-cytosine methylase
MIVEQVINHAHLYCGLGGGAKGFNRGQAKVGNVQAKFVCIGGIDVDPASCRDFDSQVGVPASCIDLFSREQYRDFHGKEPPREWREAMPDDVRRAFQNKHPHILFTSAPCKGFSGLLSEKMSGSTKYQALNGLTLRGIWLALEAFQDDPVELIVFENVPRIATRGRFLLDQIVGLLQAYGYAVSETTHDCGELGNLGQSRKRFLLVARYAPKIPCFLYEPIKHPLRGVGEILDRLPIPGVIPGIGGPMHRMPSLQWKTWVRLAFVRAGADWRSLNDLRVDNGTLLDFGILPERYGHRGTLGVRRWTDTSGTVTGQAHATRGAFNVADPREFRSNDFHGLRVNDWDQTASAITTQRSPGSSAQSVADPRVDGHHKSVQLGVRPWDQPAGVVTGKMFVGGGPNAVADPRLDGKRYNSTFRIVPWGEHSPAVTGPGGAGGGVAVADPRSTGDFAGSGKYRVTSYNEPAGTVIGASTTGQGAFALADPRPGYGPDTRKNVMRVTEWAEPGGTVTSGHSPSNGALAVADPRYENWHPGASSTKLRVTDWDEAGGTVTGSQQVASGAMSVADPRPEFLKNGDREHYQNAGNYGVVAWPDPTGAIAAHGGYDNGRWSVADPRALHSQELINCEKDNAALPGANDKLVCTIRALDGTWHRPFTTLELAALQGLVDPEEDLILDGLSDSAWRERIGNMVPPPAAAAIAGVCGITLLTAWSGQTFMMGSTPIWVRNVAVALMAAQGES